MLCFRKFLMANKVYGKEGGVETIDIFRRIFLPQSAKKFRSGTL